MRGMVRERLSGSVVDFERHRGFQRLAAKIAFEILEGEISTEIAAIVGRTADVGKQRHFGHAAERRRVIQRFAFVDIESESNSALGRDLNDCLLVDDTSTSHIYKR